MHNISKTISSISAAFFVVIYFCANHASEHPESWAAPFKNTFPIGLAFGIAAIIFALASRGSKGTDRGDK